jgi:hypothetical protein
MVTRAFMQFSYRLASPALRNGRRMEQYGNGARRPGHAVIGQTMKLGGAADRLRPLKLIVSWRFGYKPGT